MDVAATALNLTRAIPVPPAPRRHLAPGAFETALKTMGAASADSTAPATHTVRAGDSLWSICRAHLRQAGASPDASDVSAAVRQVARHNRISDADFIVPGQEIDLSVLGKASNPRSRHAGNTVETIVAPESGSSSRGGPAAVSNPRAQALWRARKIALQAKGAFVGFLKDEGAPAVPEKTQGGLLGGPAWLSSSFGMRKDPFTGRMQKHNGIDLAAAKDTEVYALKEGHVVYSGWEGDYGRLIVVRHNDGTETRYGHLADRLVKTGDKVTEETIIGKVGSSGRSTGPHLHFELHKNSRPVDPLPLVRERLASVSM